MYSMLVAYALQGMSLLTHCFPEKNDQQPYRAGFFQCTSGIESLVASLSLFSTIICSPSLCPAPGLHMTFHQFLLLLSSTSGVIRNTAITKDWLELPTSLGRHHRPFLCSCSSSCSSPLSTNHHLDTRFRSPDIVLNFLLIESPLLQHFVRALRVLERQRLLCV